MYVFYANEEVLMYYL